MYAGGRQSTSSRSISAVAGGSASAYTPEVSRHNIRSGKFPHRLNFYERPPTEEITVEQFEEWAIDRLRCELSSRGSRAFRLTSTRPSACQCWPISSLPRGATRALKRSRRSWATAQRLTCRCRATRPGQWTSRRSARRISIPTLCYVWHSAGRECIYLAWLCPALSRDELGKLMSGSSSTAKSSALDS